MCVCVYSHQAATRGREVGRAAGANVLVPPPKTGTESKGSKVEAKGSKVEAKGSKVGASGTWKGQASPLEGESEAVSTADRTVMFAALMPLPICLLQDKISVLPTDLVGVIGVLATMGILFLVISV